MSANVRSPSIARAATVRRAYDVCVVGGQLAGVAAGALLARRGFRVLHVDAEGLGAGYEDGGWRIPWGPAVVPPLKALPAAEAVLQELGLATDVSRHLEPARGGLQILLPRHRLDLPPGKAERAAELRREWPGDLARIEASFAALRAAFDAEQPFLAALPPLPPAGLRERWSLRQARKLSPGGAGRLADPLAGLGDHPLARVLAAAAPFLSSIEGPPSPLGLVRTLGAVLQGPLRAAGGAAAASALMRRKIAETRGELLGGEGEPAAVTGLEFSGGRIEALTVKGGEARYAARAFVFAGEPAALLSLAKGQDRLAHWLEPAAPVARIASLAWVVRGDALPAPLGDIALLDPGDGGAPVLLQALPAMRAGPRGHEHSTTERVLVAGTPCPVGTEHGNAAVERMRRAVSGPVPFLDRAALLESDPGRRPGAQAFHPLLAAQPDRVLGVGGLSTVSPVGNLFLAGREVLPGLGIEGEFHAALRATAAVEHHLGTKARPK